MKKLAILDDYLGVAMRVADWSPLAGRCSIEVFDRSLAVPDEAAAVLAPFHVLSTMRERMAFPRSLFERLPRLELLVVTGEAHGRLDLDAATDHGVIVANTGIGSGYRSAAELTWALVLATLRQIPKEDATMRRGGWQTRLGVALYGKTLGLVGLGNVGRLVAGYGRAFGMTVLAWSPNMTSAQAEQAGAALVGKAELFARSDVVSIHVRLGDRSRGLVGAAELGRMRPGAILVNTSRGPIVDQPSLVAALSAGTIRGAGLDVYDTEPLPADHPMRRLENAVLTPHVGYLTEDLFTVFYRDTVEDVVAWLDGRPIRVLNPAVLDRRR